MPLSGLKSMSRAAHVFVSSHGSDAYEDVLGKDPEMHEVAYTPIHGAEEHAGMPHETILHQPIDIRGCHAIGGHLRNMPRIGTLQPLRLRVFLDFSLVEAFTSTGEVLSARIYREYGPASKPGSVTPGSHSSASLELASFGTAASASDVRVHALGTIWGGAEGLADLEHKLGDAMLLRIQLPSDQTDAEMIPFQIDCFCLQTMHVQDDRGKFIQVDAT
eukprot:CAMPEP_0202418342 /NCGR_PEP_ID=MMETSP1128-20130828/46022_1 /ASSEMBLY_ACC=CAM_ASM_000463 /TAXON_ID=3047 /ORGANISM="Dunaliella tertiolecta, Strain CCMP1320" /LENGTH=217 /DNA_ID=CAMNT_0049025969 /DNA_START=109 /DNA_END=763 /DNA_ORIENTATION=+